MIRYLKIIVCLCGFVFFTSFQTINFNTKKPQLMVFVKGWQQEKEIYYLRLKVRLQNNAADTLSFVSMNCSWQELYRVKPDALKVEQNLCFANYHVIIKVAPFDHYDKEIKIKYKTGVKLNNLTCQIGFNLVEIKANDDFSDKWHELKQSKNIIWSNSITVK